MIDSVFGTETPLLVKLVIAFAVVLGLIAASTWALRRVGGSRLGVTTPRGRQPRLAVIDAAAVDTRRRLVLIRRDNVEHLIMIGGPTDVVVEQNIVRAVPVTSGREHPAARGPDMSGPSLDQPQRPQEPPRPGIPMGGMGARNPQPAEQPTRPALSAEALFGGAPDMGRPPRPDAPPRRPAAPEPPRPARPRPAPRPENDMSIEVHQAPPTADTNLANMASRLEEALKGPSGARKEPEARQPQPARKDAEPQKQGQPGASGSGNSNSRPERPAPVREPDANKPRAPEPVSPPRVEAGAAAAPAQPDPKSVFDSLEEEMASLLNRPPGKD